MDVVELWKKQRLIKQQLFNDYQQYVQSAKRELASQGITCKFGRYLTWLHEWEHTSHPIQVRVNFVRGGYFEPKESTSGPSTCVISVRFDSISCKSEISFIRCALLWKDLNKMTQLLILLKRLSWHLSSNRVWHIDPYGDCPGLFIPDPSAMCWVDFTSQFINLHRRVDGSWSRFLPPANI